MNSLDCEFQEVFPDNEDDENVLVFVSPVNPKQANALIKELSDKVPLNSLQHLKRIRRKKENGELEIIICPVESSENKSGDQFSEQHVPHSINGFVKKYNLILHSTIVPGLPPMSREEWCKQCLIWPSIFHPNSVLVSEPLSEREEINAQRHLSAALTLAETAWKSGNAWNGAVIVDPATSIVVAKAGDQTGHWKLLECGCSGDSPSSLRTSADVSTKSRATANGEPAATSEGKSHELGLVGQGADSHWHPLKHAVMAAIEISSARDRELFPTENGGRGPSRVDAEDSLDVKDMPQKRGKFEDEISGPRPYLCTGFDIYCVREPCMMCAMALVHQRLRRVFYLLPNDKNGALGSGFKLHQIKSLNHRYHVFKAVLKQT